MKLKEIIERCNFRVFTPEVNFEDIDITGGYTSDLLSDVMAACEAGSIWVTIQRHLNIVAVAKLKEIPAILITRGLVPEKSTIEKAQAEGVVLLGTGLNSFEATGKIYCLLKGIKGA